MIETFSEIGFLNYKNTPISATLRATGGSHSSNIVVEYNFKEREECYK